MQFAPLWSVNRHGAKWKATLVTEILLSFVTVRKERFRHLHLCWDITAQGLCACSGWQGDQQNPFLYLLEHRLPIWWATSYAYLVWALVAGAVMRMGLARVILRSSATLESSVGQERRCLLQPPPQLSRTLLGMIFCGLSGRHSSPTSGHYSTIKSLTSYHLTAQTIE